MITNKIILQTLDPNRMGIKSLLTQWATDLDYSKLQKQLAAHCGCHIDLDIFKECIKDYIDMINSYITDEKSVGLLSYIVCSKIYRSNTISSTTMLIARNVVMRTLMEDFIKYHRDHNILAFTNLDPYLSGVSEVYSVNESALVAELLYDKELYLDNNIKVFDLILRNNPHSERRILRSVAVPGTTYLDIKAHVIPYTYDKITKTESCVALIDLSEECHKYIFGLCNDTNFKYCPNLAHGENKEGPIDYYSIIFDESMKYKVVDAETEDLLLEYNKFIVSIHHDLMRSFHRQ